SGREADPGRGPGATQARGLRAAGRIVGYAERPAARPRRRGGKGHVDGATGAGRQGRRTQGTVVGLGEVAAVGPGDRDAGDGERRAAVIGEGDGLSRAGGANSLVSEIQACRVELR